MTAQQVADSRGWYSPWWHDHNEAQTCQALDLIASGHFSPDEPHLFRPIWDTLLTAGDFYRHLGDLTDYARAQEDVASLYSNPDAWRRKTILNVGASGKFERPRHRGIRRSDLERASLPGQLISGPAGDA